MPRRIRPAAVVMGIVFACPLVAAAQDAAKPGTPTPAQRPAQEKPPEAEQPPKGSHSADTLSDVDYPSRSVGVLIHDSDWVSVPGAAPSKNHVKHGFASSMSYGIAPAAMVSDYQGLHAKVQIKPGEPVICLCHFISLPGEPVLVRLHPVPKKDLRELHAGNLHLGTKQEEAEKSDMIPVQTAHPEETVWLVQPKQALPPGEYALMLGTQNLALFPFTVAAENSPAATSQPH